MTINQTAIAYFIFPTVCKILTQYQDESKRLQGKIDFFFLLLVATARMPCIICMKIHVSAIFSWVPFHKV